LQPLQDDTFFPTILEAVKNVNFHVGDGNYNRTKLAKAEKLRTRLLVLARSKDPITVRSLKILETELKRSEDF
jgi:hypothetical protein